MADLGRQHTMTMWLHESARRFYSVELPVNEILRHPGAESARVEGLRISDSSVNTYLLPLRLGSVPESRHTPLFNDTACVLPRHPDLSASPAQCAE
jgi:hypothetical protein